MNTKLPPLSPCCVFSGFSSKRRHRQRGAALIMTLIVVSMLTILVLAYLVTMRTERQAARAYANTQRAKMVAQGAVSHGISILRANIPDPALISENTGNAPGENWSVNPGRLTVFDDKGDVRHVPLHSGEVETSPDATFDPDVHSADLNEPLPGKSFPMIAAAVDASGNPTLAADAPPMRVQWVPVLEDPEQNADEDNPITGRYAFWIDDESSRLNFNTALGKPSRTDDDPMGFWEQYDLGMMTPKFNEGSGDTTYGTSTRPWSLGKLRSVNLDTVFDNPADLDRDGLIEHAWLRGFSRYPEAILDFVNLDEQQRREWFHRQKFNLSFYSRPPEFNAFGRPRLVTTNIPLSLEAGPLYQLPFVYNGPGAVETDFEIEGILHLHSLMGSLGLDNDSLDDGTGQGNVNADNVVNRAQFEMLKRYMGRRWPGYQNASFIDKYGERECYQMALNMVMLGRMSTVTISGDSSWAYRTTSVMYAPHATQRPRAFPERHYWPIPLEDGTIVPMLPATPGPHVTEVRLIVKPVQHGNNPDRYRIHYHYEVEYYMHGMGPVLHLNRFPIKVDFLDMVVKQNGSEIAHREIGPPDPGADAETRPDRDWNHDKSLRRLITSASGRIGPRGSGRSNRKMASSPTRSISKRDSHVPADIENGQVFDVADGRNVTLDIKWRLGVGIAPTPDKPWNNGRPRQMIPLGETLEDTLEAKMEFDLDGGEQTVVSWQINDPQLSWNKDQWQIDTEDGGTPGSRNEIDGNPIEPMETGTEKSKFRHFSRGPGSVQDPENPDGRKFTLNRGDEYTSFSRVTSKGYWSMLHTGMRNLVPWRTLDLGGSTDATAAADPPDFLLMDLLAATHPMQHDQWRINSTLPDEFSTVSFMHSTAGQVNMNSKIYPEGNAYFQAPPRRKPLEAVFKHLRNDAEIDQLLDGIDDYQRNDFFRYVGELSQVNGYRRSDVSATEFENEELLRHMIGCLTTKSNTFGLWGAAQVVKKNRDNEDYGVFEDGDQVLGEKRFYAVIERYVWPGKDGVPGNAHVDSQGKWDRIAKQPQDTSTWSGDVVDTLFQLPGSPPLRKPGAVGVRARLDIDRNGTYPVYDGPQEVEMDRYAARSLGKVEWEYSTLEDAYNPPQPAIKYRVIYFKYLDE